MDAPQRRFIFHIEDDVDDQLMLKEAVKQTDPSLQVWNANNGQEGLEVLVQFALLNTLPGLILLDLNLPGMDGKRVLTEIRKHPAMLTIPVVILTTSSSELDKMFAMKAGVKMYTKPSNEGDFFRVVRDILESIRIEHG